MPENGTVGTVGGGNTKPPQKRCRAWFLTWNNYRGDWKAQFAQYFSMEKWCMQPEVGENGTPHIQGCMYLSRGETFEYLKKRMPEVHWERARNWKDCVKYCSKLKTKKDETWHQGVTLPDRLKSPLEGKALYAWQENVVELLEGEPDDRAIHWIWEKSGNSGKTTLAKHICLTMERVIYVNGIAKDVKYAITQMKEKPRIVLWDVPRCGNMDYEGLEEVKNGFFFNGKYESGMYISDIPHVVVFANWPPETSMLSADRWDIQEIRATRSASRCAPHPATLLGSRCAHQPG